MDINDFLGVKDGEKPLDRLVESGGFCSIFRTIAVIGDSLASGEFESTSLEGVKGYHDYYEYSWGQFLARDCGSKVYNFSRGGMTAKYYVESFAADNGFWDKDKLAQAYIIAFGVNDLLGTARYEMGDISDVDLNDYHNNGKTFTGYYAQIIQRIKELQPRAKIFLVTMPRSGDEKDATRQAHREILKKFTETFSDTYLIDLFEYSPVQDTKFKEVFWHGHMSPVGYVLVAKMIESYIDYIIRANYKDFNEVGFIGTDLYYNPQKK